ncbi:MAG: UxaA family hydrolase [Pseudomonadota bacterium]
MAKKINAIKIHRDDNVITVTESLQAGSAARYRDRGEIMEILAVEDIPQYHKVATAEIQASEPVCKYGELIGEALTTIARGSHVHDHNIASPKKSSRAGEGSS